MTPRAVLSSLMSATSKQQPHHNRRYDDDEADPSEPGIHNMTNKQQSQTLHQKLAESYRLPAEPHDEVCTEIDQTKSHGRHSAVSQQFQVITIFRGSPWFL
uniref:Uncharacterized protein n=1 Tax=Arion vulgaris TaxID=1028688 RepID=A0A0B7ARR9_9EUPU